VYEYQRDKRKKEKMIKLIRLIFGLNPPCQHNWIVLDKTTVPSRFEILKDNPNRLSCQAFTMEMEKMCYKKTQVILTCTKCGKLTIETTSNYLA
jgi:hypothetical protein